MDGTWHLICPVGAVLGVGSPCMLPLRGHATSPSVLLAWQLNTHLSFPLSHRGALFFFWSSSSASTLGHCCVFTEFCQAFTQWSLRFGRLSKHPVATLLIVARQAMSLNLLALVGWGTNLPREDRSVPPLCLVQATDEPPLRKTEAGFSYSALALWETLTTPHTLTLTRTRTNILYTPISAHPIVCHRKHSMISTVTYTYTNKTVQWEPLRCYCSYPTFFRGRNNRCS